MGMRDGAPLEPYDSWMRAGLEEGLRKIFHKHLHGGRMKDWSKRGYKPRVVNEHAETEFALRFPETSNPWGQSEELDALIARSQSDSPGLDRTFLGVRVERCTTGVCIQLLAPEDASTETVELVARTLHPNFNWGWDERAVVEHVEGGWLITLRILPS